MQDGDIYLGVNSKIWVPRIWRNDLAEAVILGFGCNLANVFHGIFPLFLCRLVDWRILQVIDAARLLDGLFGRRRQASAFN